MRKNNYSQEFRESTIKFCIDNSDRSISSIARDLGLNKGTLALWVNEYKAKNNLLPVNDLKNETLEQENKRLKKRTCNFKTRKRDILVLALSVRKKAAAYFAKETL